MSLNPQSIDNKQFTVTRIKAGYDQDEVDAFLDRVAADWGTDQVRMEACAVELRKLKQRMAAASEAPTSVMDLGGIQRLLQVAQKTSDEQIAEAGREAARIVSEARQEAESIRYRATAEARAELSELRDSYEMIQHAKDEAEASIKSAHEGLSAVVKGLQ